MLSYMESMIVNDCIDLARAVLVNDHDMIRIRTEILSDNFEPETLGRHYSDNELRKIRREMMEDKFERIKQKIRR